MVSNLSNEIDQLIKEKNTLMADITEQQKNILQASSKIDKLSDKEIMQKMIEFTNDTRRSAPTTQVFGPMVISKHDRNIKQASLNNNEEVQRIFREFIGLH